MSRALFIDVWILSLWKNVLKLQECDHFLLTVSTNREILVFALDIPIDIPSHSISLSANQASTSNA